MLTRDQLEYLALLIRQLALLASESDVTYLSIRCAGVTVSYSQSVNLIHRSRDQRYSVQLDPGIWCEYTVTPNIPALPFCQHSTNAG